MEITKNDILKSGNQEFTQVLDVQERGLYGITGWTKSREQAEEKETVETYVNKHGLRYANAEVVGSVGEETDDSDDETEEDEELQEAKEAAAEEFDVDIDDVREMTKTDLRNMGADKVRLVGDEVGVDTDQNKPDVIDDITEELEL